MTSIRPSLVRARVLREHAAIREQLEVLDGLARELRDGSDRALREAQAGLQRFVAGLRDHTEFEDALLAPVLQELDAWGGLRCERLTSHHVEQRAELEQLVTRSSSEPPAGLAGMIDDFIADLLADMSVEEREYLSADLLRDDVVSDAEGG